MATYEITSPAGDVYEVTAPDNATQEEVWGYVQSQLAQQAGPPPAGPPPDLNATLQSGMGMFNPQNTGYLGNVAKGAAARGNEAMAGFVPGSLMTPEIQAQLAREKAFVERTPGAGMGAALSDMAITAPAMAVPGGLPARALATGLTEALTRPGDAKDRLIRLGGGTAGGALGEGAAKVGGTLIHPFKKGAEALSAKMIKLAKEYGIPLSGANVTGNQTLKYMDSALDALPTSSSMQEAHKTARREAWQGAVLREAGADPKIVQATPEAMGQIKEALSASYKDIHSRNDFVIDSKFVQALRRIEARYRKRLDTNQKAVVRNYIDDLTAGAQRVSPVTGKPAEKKLAGSVYQDIRSMLDKQSLALQRSDATTANALEDIRAEADRAFARHVSKADASALRETNKRWMVMKSVEESTDPMSGDISPGKFLNVFKKREKDAVFYGRGKQDLIDLARLGKAVVPQRVPSSGTAERQQALRFLGQGSPGNIGLLGALAGGATGDPATALGGAAIGGLSSLAMPPLMSHGMWNPNSKLLGGYLSGGLLDMTREALPGLSRQQIMEVLSRNVGANTAITGAGLLE